MEIQNENICRSCGASIEESFCGKCGQKKYKRIDRKYLIDELQYTFLHTNKGFFYTAKNLIKNPGKTAREYIDGDRSRHYKPILLAFVLCGISIFLSHYVFHVEDAMEKMFSDSKYPKFMTAYTEFFMKWYSIIMIGLLPVFSFSTFWAFKGFGNNFYEHIIMNSYILSFYTLLSVVTGPLIYFFPNSFMFIATVSYLLVPFMLVWFYKGFYPNQDLIVIIARVLIFIFLFVVSSMIVIFVLSFVAGILFSYFASPETIKEYFPKQN